MSDKFSINSADCLKLLSKWSFGTLFTYNSSHVSHLPYVMSGKDTIELHLANSNPQLFEIDKITFVKKFIFLKQYYYRNTSKLLQNIKT